MTTKLAGALCAVVLWTGCGGDEGTTDLPAGPTGTLEAGLSTPVPYGNLPGLSAQTAKEIAAPRFNAVSQWAFVYQHIPEQMYHWAYVPEGFYYIESHTYIEQCGGRVYVNGTFVLEYCFTKAIGP
ncbi:hypothetical protein HPC49_42775 [Pyxidicoccus fallax]|uniref:Lipoprotein n=1 Tax=Pyxidicoccus fallax TaxID=394095 RepID=A0A848LN50_9BACT|nr:hypothetical protein [Pyxidicoccus fallax]NMO19043.1 hypothetical protein [Pyxidicoccus fallax]NPC84930.1 hypothetical protein [Pyxidicoccus fallax]